MVIEVINRSFSTHFREKMHIGGEVSFDRYGDRFCSLLDMEEIQMMTDISRYTIKKVHLFPNPNPDRHGHQRYRVRVSIVHYCRYKFLWSDLHESSPCNTLTVKFSSDISVVFH